MKWMKRNNITMLATFLCGFVLTSGVPTARAADPKRCNMRPRENQGNARDLRNENDRKIAIDMTDFAPEECIEDNSNSNKTEVEIQCSVDGQSFTFSLQESEKSRMNGRRGFFGRQMGTDATTAVGEVNVITRTTANGFSFVVGSAQVDGFIYHFRTNEDGTASCTKTTLEDFPADDDIDLDEDAWLKTIAGDLEMTSDHRNKLRTRRDNDRHLSISSPYIDVLVPYTRRALCAIVDAGDPESCSATNERKAMVEDLIDLAILETNVALENSGVQGQFRLANAFLVNDNGFDDHAFSYPEIASVLQNSSDGLLDDVHVKRDQYGADLVSLLVDNQASCGIAFSGTPVSKSWAFSVVNWRCATGHYSFAHEITHNLGLRHDRSAQKCLPQNTCCGTNGCYNFGWHDVNERFRSIGAYNCPNQDCPRVQFFSQPDNFYPHESGNLIRIGNAYNDNARMIRESWDEVANYFDPPNCGNGVCEPALGENCNTCFQDCIGGYHTDTGTCGNGICEHGETCETCPNDCAGRIEIREDARYCCVGGPLNEVDPFKVDKARGCDYNFCKWNLQCDDTPAVDGHFCCGNGICEPGESVDTCPNCHCVDDGYCDPSFETTSCADCPDPSPRCMTSGRSCRSIFPDPCCNGCDGVKCL